MSDPPIDSVEALLRRYAELIDAGDFDGVGALFSEGAIAMPDGSVLAEGAPAVAAMYEATTIRHADGTPRTRHLVTNVVIEYGADDRSARVESDFVVLQQVAPGDPIVPIATGHYVDRMARDARGWRFVERRMVPQLFGDVSEHLTFDPNPSSSR